MPWIMQGSSWIDNLYDCGPGTGTYDASGSISTSKLGLTLGGSVSITGRMSISPPGDNTCSTNTSDTGSVTISYDCE
jgi:hypothetical protein